jgi:hypothetical protein
VDFIGGSMFGGEKSSEHSREWNGDCLVYTLQPIRYDESLHLAPIS